MSFADQPSLTWFQRFVLLAYAGFAVFGVLNFAIKSLAPDSDVPPPPMWERLLMFPGSLLAAIVGGCILIRYFTRDKD